VRKRPRIGIYLCHCGHNIGAVVNIPEVKRYAETLPGVVIVKENRFTCSELGQKRIAEDIKKYSLQRVIVASCTPRTHEAVFRRVLEKQGLNPYLMEMVNLREQCSWVHPREKEEATQKAKDLIRGAVMKALLLSPLQEPKSKVVKKALVVGGGVAGMVASLTLAEAGIETYLVEKEPSIGGHAASYDKIFPNLDCSLCILSPKMVEIKNHPNITLFTLAEVIDVEGQAGDFNVKVILKPRYVEVDKCVACGNCKERCPTILPNPYDRGLSKKKCIDIPFPQAVPNAYYIDPEHCLYLNKGVCRLCEKACEEKAINFTQKPEIIELNVGAIILATGFELFDAKLKRAYGYKIYPNVLTNLDFERILSATGPTEGKLKRMSDGKDVKSVAFIQCVGSRDEKSGATYCSSICCSISIKQALQIKEKYPGVEVYVYHNDIRTTAKKTEELYRRAREQGVLFIRGKPSEIRRLEDERLELISEDIDSGMVVCNHLDLVVLAAGIRPNAGINELLKKLHVSKDKNGFVLEHHPNLNPTETNVDGIFIAGCIQGPKDIAGSVAQGKAAAASVLALLEKDEIKVEGIVAVIDEAKCSRCRICESVCPAEAIRYREEENRMEVVEILCKGCGLCTSSCLSGAIQLHQYKDEQLLAQIKGILSSKA